MEYKRLTGRDNWGGCVTIKNGILKDEIWERLCELEDKIENGTLVELPCKVGDGVYILSGKTIRAEVVKQIKHIIDNGRIDLLNSYIMTDDVYGKDYSFYRLTKLGKSLFLTEPEAEKKLEELKNGRKKAD